MYYLKVLKYDISSDKEQIGYFSCTAPSLQLRQIGYIFIENLLEQYIPPNILQLNYLLIYQIVRELIRRFIAQKMLSSATVFLSPVIDYLSKIV